MQTILFSSLFVQQNLKRNWTEMMNFRQRKLSNKKAKKEKRKNHWNTNHFSCCLFLFDCMKKREQNTSLTQCFWHTYMSEMWKRDTFFTVPYDFDLLKRDENAHNALWHAHIDRHNMHTQTKQKQRYCCESLSPTIYSICLIFLSLFITRFFNYVLFICFFF